MSLSNPQKALYNSIKRRNLFMAGVGSGKSFIGGVLSARFVAQFPLAIGFIGANSYSQLSKSTLVAVYKVWGMFGMVQGVNYVVDKQPKEGWPQIHEKMKSYENVISFDNGARIYVASLENYQAIDGSEFAWAILDETKDTREEAVKEVIVARLRGKGLYINNGELSKEGVSFNPLYILTSPAKVAWLNEWFGLDNHYEDIVRKIYSKTDFYKLETDRELVVISSTYHNEENLTDGYIEALKEDYKITTPHLIDMLIYGSPIAKSGGEFYHRFERLKHIRETQYDPSLSLHITFDFNVKPYITALVFQVKYEERRYKLCGLKEYCFKAPKNNSEDLSAAILHDYYEKKKTQGRLFYLW